MSSARSPLSYSTADCNDIVDALAIRPPTAETENLQQLSETLDVVALQGVFSDSSRRELLPVLSRDLGLVHVITGVGAKTIGMTTDSGLLIASRFPVLYQKFSAFPAHKRCVHPALNAPKSATGARSDGVLAALLDTSTEVRPVQPTGDR